MGKEVDARSLIEAAYRNLKRLMLQQKIIPGQKLPYRDLCQRLRMSKTPIVNALNRLEQEGFVVSEPNCGYTLKPIDSREITDSSEVREALEARVVERVVQSAAPSDLAALEKKLAGLEAHPLAMPGRNRFVLNAEFHLQLAEITGNRVLKYLLKRNFEHILLRVNLDKFGPESASESNREHRRLLKSLKKRDSSSSIAIVQQHIRKTRDLILSQLSRETEADLAAMDFFEERPAPPGGANT